MNKYTIHYKNVIAMKNVKKLAIMTLAIMLIGILPMSSVSSIPSIGQPYCPHLSITAPSTVYENQEFTVHVFANNQPVPGAWVSFSAFPNMAKQTNSDGIVNFWAPEVDADTVYTITASKIGYSSATASITVINQQLVIQAPSSVIENQEFTVHVFANNQPVPGAWVSFSAFPNMAKQTNSDGIVNFWAPEVDADTVYTITASKIGYSSATASITVINFQIYQQNSQSNSLSNPNKQSSSQLLLKMVQRLLLNIR